MIVIKKILILVLSLTSFNLSAQNFLDTVIYTIDSNLVDIKVDKLGNIWKFYPENIIRTSQDNAYNDTLNFDYSIEDIVVDLTFPLKNLFYNRSKNLVEIYNSRWGIMSTLKLDKINIFQPSLVQFSSDENYWILDKSSNNFLKINETGVQKRANRNPFYVNKNYYYPTKLIDFKYFLVTMDKNYGLFVTDNYGSLSQTIKIDSIIAIHRFSDILFIEKNNRLEEYKYNEIEKKIIKTGRYLSLDSKIISIQALNKQALIFKENKRLFKIDNFEKLFQK